MCHERQYITRCDSFEDVFQKTKQTCINFNIIQFGLATFHWDDSLKQYKAKCFNFFLKKTSSVHKNIQIISVYLYLSYDKLIMIIQ